MNKSEMKVMEELLNFVMSDDLFVIDFDLFLNNFFMFFKAFVFLYSSSYFSILRATAAPQPLPSSSSSLE